MIVLTTFKEGYTLIQNANPGTSVMMDHDRDLVTIIGRSGETTIRLNRADHIAGRDVTPIAVEVFDGGELVYKMGNV